MQEKLRVIARKSVRQPNLSVSKRLVFLLIACSAGVILGRVVFLHALFPCVLPAFATALFMRKKTALWVGAGLTIGAWTMRAEGTNPWLVVSMMLAFYGLIILWRRIEAIELSLLPFMVFLVDTGFRLGFYLPITGLSLYTIVISFVDGALSFLMTSMALQIPAMVTTLRPHTQLRIDEIIAMVIALSSMLTGLHGPDVSRDILRSTKCLLCDFIDSKLGRSWCCRSCWLNHRRYFRFKSSTRCCFD
nr:hypothetical protein [Bacilli bacterium]